MSEQKPNFWASFLPKLAIGIAFIVGGSFVSGQSAHWGWVHTLAEKGIPIDPGKTLSIIGVLVILFPVINFFYLKPLNEAIDNRTQTLESTFTEAEALRQEMTKMKSDYESRLTETEANAREQIQAQVRDAQELRRQIMAEASGKADEFLKKAQEEIAAERDRAMVNIRVQVATVALAAAEKVVGENMDNEKNRKLIDEFIDTVEVPKA